MHWHDASTGLELKFSSRGNLEKANSWQQIFVHNWQEFFYFKPNVFPLIFRLALQWDLVCKDSWQIPVHNLCFVTGSILGYIVFGALCDW